LFNVLVAPFNMIACKPARVQSDAPISLACTQRRRLLCVGCFAIVSTASICLAYLSGPSSSVLDPLSNPKGVRYPVIEHLGFERTPGTDPCSADQPSLIPQAQKLLDHRVVLDGNVSNMLLVAQSLGLRALFEVLPLEYWHLAGQAVASLPCFQRDLPAGIALLDRLLVPTMLAPFKRANAGVPVHGAIWYLVSQVNASWEFIMNAVCPYMFSNYTLMHGVGHGFLITHAATEYGPASLMPPVQDRAAVALAVEDCKRAPDSGLMHFCTNGLYHGVAEYGDFSTDTSQSAWMAPCDELDLPAYCFLFLFHDGLAHSWRRSKFDSATDGLRAKDVCSERYLRDEEHLRSCIHGLAARGFLTYARTQLLLREGNGSRSDLELCEDQAKWAFLPGHMTGRDIKSELSFCRLLFDGTNHRTDAPISIFDLCSLITPTPQKLDGKLAYRWLACIAGSLGYHANLISDFHYLANLWARMEWRVWRATHRSAAQSVLSGGTDRYFNKSMVGATFAALRWSDVLTVAISALISSEPMEYCRHVPPHLNVNRVWDWCWISANYASTFPDYLSVIYSGGISPPLADRV